MCLVSLTKLKRELLILSCFSWLEIVVFLFRRGEIFSLCPLSSLWQNRFITLSGLKLEKSNRYSATTPENIDVSSTLKGATSTNHVTDQKVRNTL